MSTDAEQARIERMDLWRDIVYLDKQVTNELQRLFEASEDEPPWGWLTRQELVGLQERLTGTIHRIRVLQEKGRTS